jgi:rhombotail lipoprotein
MKKLAVLLFVGVASVGCSANFSREEMARELQEDRRIVFDDEDVLKIEQLRPQIQYPFRLAVVPPARVGNRLGGDTGTAKGEHEALMAIGEQLKKEGIVSSFSIIPQFLIDTSSHRGSIKGIRLAAARMQADAILVLRSVTDVDSTVNPLSVLDLTIVGMFLVPGHQKHALTMLEGMIIDNRNQFLYFAAAAEGAGSTYGPLAVVEERDAVGESRRNAMNSFGEMLLKEARQAKGVVPGPRYETPGK